MNRSVTGNGDLHVRRVVGRLDDVLIGSARRPCRYRDVSLVRCPLSSNRRRRRRPVSGAVAGGRHEQRHVLVAALVVAGHDPRRRAVGERTRELDGRHVHLARQRAHDELAPDQQADRQTVARSSAH